MWWYNALSTAVELMGAVSWHHHHNESSHQVAFQSGTLRLVAIRKINPELFTLSVNCQLRTHCCSKKKTVWLESLAPKPLNPFPLRFKKYLTNLIKCQFYKNASPFLFRSFLTDHRKSEKLWMPAQWSWWAQELKCLSPYGLLRVQIPIWESGKATLN